ncbi:MAG: bifunctional helix-turn-helix domain-containing protein/methylated-DNA--[protein]-cysteine S-methyltransferase [Candidatus Lambdaproteobacteria bacterium]|nr:bifunctional helix-turn-helix domain-containing protein/methylated-DNA--[protein]-cysteine S-methyltransferase [Candidatus Lambdaproteobacteria bacterium]
MEQQICDDYNRMERAIHFLVQHVQEQPSLDEIAASVHLSKFHFQRMFTRWAGISPKRFLQYLTLNEAKDVLVRHGSVLDAAYEAGLSSPGRLHDLFVTYEALTPGEYKAGAAGLRIGHGFQPSPFGRCLLAFTARGICGLSFVEAGGEAAALAELRATWPGATLAPDDGGARRLARRAFGPDPHSAPLKIVLRGTAFQIKVWEALLALPPGEVVSYGDLARRIGAHQAARAVGNALHHNPVAFLIPCHRVIRKVGRIGGYRYGEERKRAMLAWEAAQRLRRQDGAAQAGAV